MTRTTHSSFTKPGSAASGGLSSESLAAQLQSADPRDRNAHRRILQQHYDELQRDGSVSPEQLLDYAITFRELNRPRFAQKIEDRAIEALQAGRFSMTPDELDKQAAKLEALGRGEAASRLSETRQQWTPEVEQLLEDVATTHREALAEGLSHAELGGRVREIFERASSEGLFQKLPEWFYDFKESNGPFTRVNFPMPADFSGNLYAVQWKKGSATNIHNHRIEGGVEVVAMGSMTAFNFETTGEVKVQDEGAAPLEEIRFLGSHTLRAKSSLVTASLDGENNRHIGSSPEQNSLTIHFYPAPIDGDDTHMPVEPFNPESLEPGQIVGWFRKVESRIGVKVE